MLPRLAEGYRLAGNDLAFEIEDKGTSSAFTNLLAGTADIGIASRPAKDEEKAKFAAAGKWLVEHIAATDMIAVVVNEKVAVENLTLKQLERIYTGEVTDWSDVGGKPGKITAYTRNEQSGYYWVFKKLALPERDYGAETEKVRGCSHPTYLVAEDPTGIGYCGKAYVSNKGVKALSIDGIPFAPENRDTYPLARKLYWYTVGEPIGRAREFLDWATKSAAAAEIINGVGFIANPVKE